MDRAERAFHRGRHVELRIGERDRAVEIDPEGALDQHRRIGDRRFELVGEFERGGAPGRQQDRRVALGIERLHPPRVGRLDRQQPDRRAGALDGDRPAAAQRVDRAGDVACTHRAVFTDRAFTGRTRS